MTLARKAGGMKRDTNLKTAQMVQIMSEIGPDIPEIARRVRQFKESVRYRYKEKVLARGMAIQAAIDHEKLGLKRVIFIIDFAEDYGQYAQSILTAMSELCYVTGFDRAMPEGSYVVNASVPEEFVGQFTDFLRGLEAKALFRCSNIITFDWFRNVPMRAEFYDFDTGRWDFDWSTLGKPKLWQHIQSRRGKFDYTDLLILKELRIDATRPMVEIAKKLGVNYKKLGWHYNTHVSKMKLIKGYSLNWMGTRYDFKIEKALHRKHRYFAVDLLVENLSKVERMELMAKTNALPFLWAEIGGQSYWAQFAFPVDNIVEAYRYLTYAIERVKDRAQIYVMDQADALSFTISYKLYDERKRAWTFNQEQLLTKFGDLMLKIRQGAG